MSNKPLQTNQPQASMEQIPPNKWRTIYPQYINSNLTIQRGRRLPKDKCVKDPNWLEIRDVLAANPKIQVQENPRKIYNRELDKENPYNQGYIKYICNDPELATKKRVLFYVASLIPKLKARMNPKGEGKPTPLPYAANYQQAVAAPVEPVASSSGQGGSGGGGGGGNKKKNRRK